MSFLSITNYQIQLQPNEPEKKNLSILHLPRIHKTLYPHVSTRTIETTSRAPSFNPEIQATTITEVTQRARRSSYPRQVVKTNFRRLSFEIPKASLAMNQLATPMRGLHVYTWTGSSTSPSRAVSECLKASQ